MSIQEKYEEIIQCMTNMENWEKYQKLCTGTEHSKDDDMFQMALSKLNLCIVGLKKSNNLGEVNRKFLESTANMWITRIEKYLQENEWT